MKCLIKKNNLITKFPEQGTLDSVGYDIIAAQEPVIVGTFIELPMEGLKLYKTIQYIQYHTGVFISPQRFFPKNKPNNHTDYYTLIFPRSSITTKNLILKNSVAVIDTDYTGELLVRMAYIPQPEDMFIMPEGGINRVFIKINKDKIYNKGDSICQLVAFQKEPIEFEWVDKLPETKRAEGGFGSTNK